MAVASVSSGLAIELCSGYYRSVDAMVMRVMHGLRAVPAIVLAITVLALNLIGDDWCDTLV